MIFLSRFLRIFSGLPGMAALLLSMFWIGACQPDDPGPGGTAGDLEHIPYAPQPYAIAKPSYFPEVPIPADNPMTVEGVQLGRRLFYDPLLSADSTQSCSSCHLPAGSFTDNKAVSRGIDGLDGRRSSMSLLNVAYATDGLFWDGRVQTLEEQALRPVEDPVEMHHSWINVVDDLKQHPNYPALFRKAFGITKKDDITKELAAKALAQFERILISSGTSKFDRFKYQGEQVFDDEELDGFLLFSAEGASVGLPDAQCSHCHGNITLTGNTFFSNGLDDVDSFEDYVDKGRGEVTGKLSDNGKFRTPTLRNIALTAPYMHDGRFKTLEEVVDFYGKHGNSNVPFVNELVLSIGQPLGNGQHAELTPYMKQALVKFLHTLTDTAFVNNPDIQNPFQ
jgi:cytochrome c peroxidase